MPENQEKLISIDELISRAKKMGIDFGNGNPRHRLRYYTKIGLLPHAQRKCFNNNLPQGAYPESVLNLLFEIDKKIKEGKTIQAIKRELKKEKEEKPFDFSFTPSLPTEFYQKVSEISVEDRIESEFQHELKEKDFGELKEFTFEKKPKKLNLVFSLILVLVFFGFLIFFLQTKADIKKAISSMVASLTNFRKLAQIENPPFFTQTNENVTQALTESYYEPYLTINAETAIMGPLKVKDEIFASIFNITKDGFLASFKVDNLTDNRNYIFPNQSGTVCLSTGNCIGLAGEIFSQGAIANRITKFISANRITSSSINDLYNLGVALTIDALGRVGIGTANPRARLEVAGDFLTPNLFVSGQANGRVGIKTTNPQYDLHVQGRIQASGDICTDLEGGKCLSKLTEGGNVYIAGGGISGLGTSGNLPLWTGSRVLGNSLISQSGDNVSIAGNLALTKNLTVSGNANILGTTTMAGFILPSGAQEGYILTSDSSGIGRWLPAPTGTIPEGQLGYTLRHDGTNWIADDFLYNSGSLIGIGTNNPNQTLSIVGSLDFDILGIYTSSSQPVLYLTNLGNIGIGTTTPSANLSVAGSFLVTGSTTFNGISYTWPSSPGSSGYILTTDGNGNLSWTAGGILGSGTQYYIPRWSGSMALEDSILYNNGDFLGIGTTSELAKLTVAGSGYFLGPLTLDTSSLPQLVVKYDDNNYLNFAVDSDSSTILASKKMVLNSLTGEIALASNVTSFDATSAAISGSTFLSAANDATVRKSGELILRASVPIFKFSVPAQTTSTLPTAISKQISTTTLDSTLPETLPGTTRYFAFLLNFADNIPLNASSTWTIDLATGSDIQFTFSGQAMADLKEGTARLSEIFLPPNDNWQLKVNVPSQSNTIRVFNVFLLVFDRVN